MLRKLYHNVTPIGWFLAFITSFCWRTTLPQASNCQSPKERLLLVFPIIPTIENYEMVNEQFCGLLREKYGQIGDELGIEIKTLFITEGTTITQQAARKDWNVINKISSTIGMRMAYAPDHIFNFHRDLKIQEDPLDLLRFLPEKKIDSNILLLKSAQMSMEKENIKLLMDSIKSSGVVCVRNCGRPEALGLDPLSLEKLRAKLPVVKPQFQPSETRYLLKEFLTAAKKFLTRSHKIIPISSAVTVIANERAQFGSYYKHEMPEYIQASNLTYWMISDELAPQYKKIVPKKENIGFLFLPENISKTKCNEAESEFVYLIKTARNEVMERFATRRMFKSDESFKAKNYFFMLGSDSDGSAFGEDSYLREEAEKYQDIVIADFVDTYNNLPTKTQSMYDFATTYCSDSVLYFVFHDSDTIIDSRELEHRMTKKVSWERLSTSSKRTITGLSSLKDNLDVKTDFQIPFLRNISEEEDGHGVVHEALENEKGQIFCLRPTGWNHNAKNTEKYNITQSEYPPLFRLPEYCNGQGAILNRIALEKIHQVSKVTEMGSFRIEDIYFTGILRAKAGIQVPERVLSFDSEKISSRGNLMHTLLLFAKHNSKDAFSGTSPVLQDDKLIYAAASGFFPQVLMKRKATEDFETDLKVGDIESVLGNQRDALEKRLEWFYEQERKNKNLHLKILD